MSTLPTIVVVDSSKAPEEQAKTQITIYNPKKERGTHPKQLMQSAKKGKRANRVQRRIDSSKSKISAVAKLQSESGSETNGAAAVSEELSIVVPTAKPGLPNMGSKGRKVEKDHVRKNAKIPKKKPVRRSSDPNVLKKGEAPPQPEVAKVKASAEDGEKSEEALPDPELPEVTEEASQNEDAQGGGEKIPEITVTDTADQKRAIMPSPTPSMEKGEETSPEDKELERIKMKIEENMKPRDAAKDKETCETVVKAFQMSVANRRPAKIESKWHLWKYQESDNHKKESSWVKKQMDANVSTEVGWGRRIYDKNEIETEDRERERQLLNDDTVRHLNLRIKDVPEKYGLWDNVYDKRVIRVLDCNSSWKPNRKEEERRKKIKARRERKLKKKMEENKEADGGNKDSDDDDDDDDPFSDSKKKWFTTGAELTQEDMDFIFAHTKFTEEAIRRWFGNFREECPNGKLTKNHLHSLFKKIFPGGDSEVFCNHIFRIFDSDGNGFLDFKEFLMALDVTSCRSEEEKLQWAFRLYDVDDSGSINLKEITAIMETLDRVEGGDEDGFMTVEERAEEIFNKLDADGDGEVTMDEFVEGYLKWQQKFENKLKRVSAALSKTKAS